MKFKNEMTSTLKFIVIALGVIVTLFWLNPYKLSFLPVSLNGILLLALIIIHVLFQGRRIMRCSISLGQLNNKFKIQSSLLPLLIFFIPYMLVVVFFHSMSLNSIFEGIKYIIDKWSFFITLITGCSTAYLCVYYLRFPRMLNLFLCIIATFVSIASIIDLMRILSPDLNFFIDYIYYFQFAFGWGSFIQPINYGLALIMGGVALLYIYNVIIKAKYSDNKIIKYLLLTGVGLMFVVISINSVFTGARAIWVSYTISIFLYFVMNKKYNYAFLIVSFYVALIIIIPAILKPLSSQIGTIRNMQAVTIISKGSFITDTLAYNKLRDDLLNERYTMAMTGINMFLSAPFTGVGINNFKTYSRDYVPEGSIDKLKIDEIYFDSHNVYIKILAESGVIGFGGFLLMLCWALIKIFRQHIDNISNKQKERIAVTVPIVISFLTVSMLHDLLFQRIWWVSLGLLLIATIKVSCKR